MSNIFATRRGFLYQDRFAVAKYLEKWRDIKEYFIDYPLINKKSIDVRYIDKFDTEHIYEVKSGEQFKKESSEIMSAVSNLFLYQENNQNFKLYLIIRKGFKNKISKYWDNIQQIKNSSLRIAKTKENVQWLAEELSLLSIKKTDKELYDLCQIISVDDFFDDELAHADDFLPDIDDFVVSKINDISNILKITACAFEYPSEILMYELYHNCRIYAGECKNIHPIFKKVIIGFFAKRKLLDGYSHPNNKNATEAEINKDLTKEINRYLNEADTKNVEVLNNSEGAAL